MPHTALDGVVRVFVVDDHAVMRQSLCKLVDNHPDLMVVGAAASAEEALSQLESVASDVVLVDLSLPGMSGHGLIERLRATRPELRALVVSGHDSAISGEAALLARASGCIMKDDLPGIPQAVHSVVQANGGELRRPVVNPSCSRRRVKKGSVRSSLR